MNLETKTYGAPPYKLLIFHGLLGSNQNWVSVSKELSEQISILVPSLRNHGESGHGTHTIDAMTEDVIQLISDAQADKVALLGHSMGGLVAMDFAMKYPEKLDALIVVDVTPRITLGRMTYILEALLNLDLNQVQSREDADRQLSKNLPVKTTRQFLLQNLKRKQDGSYGWQCNLPELHRFVTQTKGSLFSDSETYAGPALFIGGGRSEHRLGEKVSAIKGHFPNAEVKIIQEADHWVHFDARSEFIEIVEEFLGAHKLLAGNKDQ